MLQFKQSVILFFILFNLLLSCSYAINNIEEIDLLMADLACQNDKNSQNYINTKKKLQKLILNSNIDYSADARIKNSQRLIKEKKYNAAIYELKDLIQNKIQISKSNELLGDICIETNESLSKAVKYYKKALAADNSNISAAFKLAKIYLKANKNTIAIAYLKQVVELSQDTAYFSQIEDIILNKITPQNHFEANNLYETLGILYLKSNRNIDGYRALTKALESNSSDIYLRYQFANILYNNNENQNALILFNSILEENPYDTQIKVSKAKTLYKLGNLESAYREYLDILQNYPDSNQAKYGIYQIFKDKLTPEKIISKFHNDNPIYSTTLEEIEDFIRFLNSIKDNESAKIFNNYLIQLKNEEENYKNYNGQKGSREEKLNIELQKAQQIELAEAEEKTDIVEKTVEEKIAKEKTVEENNVSEKKEEVILKAQEEKREKLELENLEKKKQIALEDELQQKRLEEKRQIERIENRKKNDTKEAENELIKAKNNKEYNQYKKTIDNYLTIKPYTINTYIAIANTYKQAKMPYNAIKYYNEAKKLEPLNSDIYYNIGLTYMELNRLNDSKEVLEHALNLDSENKKAQTLLSFVNQKIATSIINKAYTNFQNNKLVESYTILDKGIKDIPNNAQLYYYRALVTDKMNRNAASIIDLQKSIELDPTYYMAYYNLGKVYEKIKDYKSALVAYERFLSIEPDEKELVDEIQKKVITLGQKYY